MVKKRVQTEPAAELPPEIWDVRQTMAFLKVGRATLYELMKDGLPSRMVGGSRRFDPREIAQWWADQRESA